MMTLIVLGRSRHIIFSPRRRAACHPASFPYRIRRDEVVSFQVWGCLSSNLSLCFFFWIIIKPMSFILCHVLFIHRICTYIQSSQLDLFDGNIYSD